MELVRLKKRWLSPRVHAGLSSSTARAHHPPQLRLLSSGKDTGGHLYVLFVPIIFFEVQSNLVIRNVLIRYKLALRNHFPWPNANLLHKDKEYLALRNNFRVTKRLLITKFDCTTLINNMVVLITWMSYTYLLVKLASKLKTNPFTSFFIRKLKAIFSLALNTNNDINGATF